MEAQKNLLSNFADIDSLSLDYDFNNDGKVDAEDYKIALDFMNTNGTDSAFGVNKSEIEEVFAQFVSDFSENTLATSNAPISFIKGNSTYHFFEDRDNNGILDDASELLGAKDGWNELQAYDADGNGKIEGDELKKLRIIKVNNETGEYEYMTAFEAGINEIDLSSLANMNINQTAEDIMNMSVDIKMLNEDTLPALRNDVVLKTIEEQFSDIFGSKITDYDGNPDDISYMEDFVKNMNE